MRETNDWKAHKLIKRTRNNLCFEEQGEDLQPTGDELPVTEITLEKQQIRTRIPKETLKTPEQLDHDLYFKDYIETL